MPLRRTKYVLKFTSDAVADVKTALPRNLRGPLKKDLTEVVAKDPIGCSRELHGELAGYRSYTWQDYRVVYKVFDDLRAIAVVGIGLRSPESMQNIYRKLEILARTGELAQGALFSLRGFTTEQQEEERKRSRAHKSREAPVRGDCR